MSEKTLKIYLASSWRNNKQPETIKHLRDHGYKVYDFRNPISGNHGFHWSDMSDNWKHWDKKTFRDNLTHPIAIDGFKLDFNAMQQSDICVMLMPF